jgi:hypothetical protein
MLAGTYNPGQLVIQREILNTGDAVADFDTAKFSDVLANYVISAPDADGRITVSHIVGGAPGIDGTDTLMNIERLEFTDQSVVLGGLNEGPAGLLAISNAAPVEDQPLTVSIAGVTDANNVSAGNPTGAITGPVSYVWQADPGTGVFTDSNTFTAGEVARATGPSFTPTEDQVGNLLRVRAVYKDANGVLEEVFSAPTAIVGNVNDAPVGLPAISDATPTEGFQLTASTAGITDADGLTAAVFTFQWQQSDLGGGGVFTDIGGETGSFFTPGEDQVNRQLRVVVTYIDDQGTLETVISAQRQ